MDEFMQEIVDKAVAKAVAEAVDKTLREKEILYVRNLLQMGIDFDEAVKLVKVSVTPIDELRGMLLPGD